VFDLVKVDREGGQGGDGIMEENGEL